MDKPAWRVVIAVETRPEQPEASPLLVLDPVIISDRIGSTGAFRLPPFLGDPFRPIGVHHPMPAAPPDEAERRVVGQQPERFDRLRRLEQPDRPRGFDPPPHPPPPRPVIRGSAVWVRVTLSPRRVPGYGSRAARFAIVRRALVYCRAGREAARCRSSRC